MDKTQHKRSAWTLTILILLGLAYSGLLRLHVSLTAIFISLLRYSGLN